jgi:hypothetical protein
MQITVTTYACGCKDSVTSHPRHTRGQTVRRDERSPLKCNKHSQPILERLRDGVAAVIGWGR